MQVPVLLEFQSLHIERATYGAHTGKLTAKVRARYTETTLEVVVPPEITADIMRLVAPVITKQVESALMDVITQHETFISLPKTD